MTRLTRRSFLKSTATAAALGGSLSRVAAAQSANKNGIIGVGVIGLGGRGNELAKTFESAKGANVIAVADPDAKRSVGAGERYEAQAYEDLRELLDDKNVDAVAIATCNHWHCLAAIWALQAGKDVYVEKPLSLTVSEGRKMVDAARKYNRVVQTGTQHRSAPHYREVQEIVQSGKLGEVRFVRVWNFVNRFPNGIGNPPDAAPPEGLDWDFYLGPAPKVPFNPARFLGTFRWFRDYSGGYITDYGAHRFDTVQQVMGVTAPKSVSSTGGKFSIKDIGDIPDILQVTYEYPGFVLSYEAILLNGFGCGALTPGQKYYNAAGDRDRPHGESYYGTNGTLIADRIGYEVFPELKGRGSKLEPHRMNTTDATKLHAANFIDCVRSRKKPNADVEIGHTSNIVPLIGNLSYDTGKKLHWDAAKEDFTGAPEATKLLSKTARRPWDLI